MKNKNIINSNYKRGDRRWLDIESLILKTTATVINIANICLDAGNKNCMIESKEIIVKVIDTIILLGRTSQQITFERKERLKSSLSEAYRATYDQDHSSSKFLLEEDLTDAKTTYTVNQTISAKK